jgi:hypothetical protein
MAVVGEVEAILKIRDELSGKMAQVQREFNANMTKMAGGSKQTGQNVKNDFDQIGRSVSSTNSIFKTMIGTMGGFVSAQAIIGAARSAFSMMAKATIDMNSTLETSELQFATLMQSTDRARVHIKDLFEIAKKTPFETGPIINASRTLEVMGGAALNTKANIVLIGDTAAATGAPIDELSRWVGRLYASLQSGKPFGEAAENLRRLGIWSPELATKMESLNNTAANGSKNFQVFTDHIARFSGAMEKQAGTWQGLVSTMKDSVNMAIAGALKPLFEEGKRALGGLNQWLESPAASEWAESITRWIRDSVIPAMRSFGDTLRNDIWPIIRDDILPFLKSLGGALLEGIKAFKNLWDEVPTPVKAAAAALWLVHAAIKAINVSASTGMIAKVLGMGPLGLLGVAGGAAYLAGSHQVSGAKASMAGMMTGRGANQPYGRSGLLTPEDLAGVKPLDIGGALTIAGFGSGGAGATGGAGGAGGAGGGGGISKDLLKWMASHIGLDVMDARQLKDLMQYSGAKSPSLITPFDALLGVPSGQSLSSRWGNVKMPSLQAATGGTWGTEEPVISGGEGWFSGMLGQLPQTIMGALMGGGSLTKSIGSLFGGSITEKLMSGSTGAAITNTLKNTLGKTLGGAVGSMIPGIGALLGPAISWIGGLFGPGKEYQQVKGDRASFEQSFGGVDAMIAAVSKAYADLGRSGTEAEAALKQLWNAKTPEAYKAAVDQITKAIADAKTQAEKLEQIAGLEDQIKALQDSAIPSWQEMTELAEKYGMDLDSLGERYQQLRIDDLTQDILSDFERLQAGGASYQDILNAMADEMSELVTNSIDIGAKIPENMRPFLEAMIEQGILLDANGEKISDISQLTFGDAVKTDAELLRDTIKDLVDTLEKLRLSLEGVPSSLPDPFAGWQGPPDMGDYDMRERGGGGNDVMMAAGGIVTRPTRAIIGEAGPEAVIPLSAASIGWTSQVSIPVTLNGVVLGQAIATLQVDALRRSIAVTGQG